MDGSPTVPPPGDDRTRISDGASLASAVKATALPTRIGKYRILRLIGEGGMGAVYEAEQEQPRRTVALKVIRSGHVSAAMLRRFEHESEVLGRLQHPGIAQVHEAGTVEDAHGQRLPFFAMELIRGEELDTYAKKQALGTRARLELIARICDAVSHAHQKGVIHRDLKPGNILVDEAGQPKILDFGVARATDSDLQRTTMRTDVGELIGTIPYMSPEQVSGDPGQLDTRSDVYALGVIAYELLAGRMPYDLQKRMIHDALRVIREEEPTRLSRIDRTLRGDVETIVGKALEKDKTRRYASAEALAGDIRRYLANEPISARPASTWYQAAKFARRNKGLVTGLAVAMLLLVAGLIGVGFAWREAVAAGERETRAREGAQKSEAAAVAARAEEEKQRQQAERDRKRAESDRDKSVAIAEFLVTTLGAVNAGKALGRDTELLEAMLDDAAARIDNGELARAPEAELYLRNSIGPLFVHISRPEKAKRMLEPALAMQREAGVETLELAKCLAHLALAEQQVGELRSAIALQQQAVAMCERLVPGDSRELSAFLCDLGTMHLDIAELEPAEASLRRGVDMSKRLALADRDLANALSKLGLCLLRMGKLEAAEATLREALDATRTCPPNDPVIASVQTSLGQTLKNRGKLEEAEERLRSALELRRRLYRNDHELLANGLSSLSAVLVARKELVEGEALAREALAMFQRLYPGDHDMVAGQLNNLGHLLQQKGDLAAAEPCFRESMAMLQRILPDHPNLPSLLHNLACLLQAKKDFAGAEPLFRDALARMRHTLPKGHPFTALILFNLGNNLRDAGDLEQAEALHREALAMRRALFQSGHFSVEQSLHTLGELLVQRGDHAGGEAMIGEAKELRAKLGMKPR